MRRAPRESAATPDTATSTGLPAARAACSVGAFTGSRASTWLRLLNQAANPATRPPPPTLTSTRSGRPASSSISRPSVPAPTTTSGWS